MKITDTHGAVERGGDVAVESTFTIKATAKAFDILSSGLYANKALAIVRELACNAYDSHVAAGIPDDPIEIRLPTHLDPTFYVRDNGLGLHDFDVRGWWERDGEKFSLEHGSELALVDGEGGWVKRGGIYNTYFESTKTNSDDFIGQLGLGSKSPFSYASTFMVGSRFNGVKSLYSCYKNDYGLPSVALMGSEQTNEPNGVTVSLSIKIADLDRFITAAKRALMYFKPLPTIVGLNAFKPYELVHTVCGDSWRIRQTEHSAYMTGPYVVQGFVAYPVDVDQLAANGLSDIATHLIKTNLDLFVPIGQVEVAASREALSYTKSTIGNIAAALDHAASQLRSTIQADINSLPTAWEAAVKHYMFQRGGSEPLGEVYGALFKREPFTWNGSAVDSVIQLDLSTAKQLRIRRVHSSRSAKQINFKLAEDYSWVAGHSITTHMTFPVNDKTCFVIDDTDNRKNSDARVAGWLCDRRTAGGDRMQVLIIDRGEPKTPLDVEKALNIVALHPGAPVVMVSSLPVIDRRLSSSSRTRYARRAKEDRLVWKGFKRKENRWGRDDGEHQVFSASCWTVLSMDMDDHPTGYYIPVDRFTALTSTNSPWTDINQALTHLRALHLVSDDVSVVGVPQRELAAFERDNPGWSNLYTEAVEIIKRANANDELTTRLVVHHAMTKIGAMWQPVMMKNWAQYQSQLNDGPFVEFMVDLIELNKSAHSGEPDTIAALDKICPTAGVITNVDGRVAALVKEWAVMLKRYPMLELVAGAHGNQTRRVAEYVRLVDNYALLSKSTA